MDSFEPRSSGLEVTALHNCATTTDQFRLKFVGHRLTLCLKVE